MKKRLVGINGFTLIELLVVMGVIAVLAAMSIFGLQGARESGRDARRKGDLETIRSGLELYRADCGVYPSSAGANFATTFGTSLVGDEGGCSPANANIYISENPTDPISGRLYYYVSSGTTYTICTALEGNISPDSVCTGIPASCGSTCSYHVSNP